MTERRTPNRAGAVRISRSVVRSILLVAALAVAGCGEPDSGPGSATTPATLSGIRYLSSSGDMDAGFARALEPRAFEFPADYGSHPDFRTEWWYFTGNLFDRGQRHYGFELTLFRIALSPARGERDSALASNQVWMANLAVTDTEGRTFYAAERLSREAPGIAGDESGAALPVRLRVEDWSLAIAGDSVTIEAADAEFGIDLTLTGLERIVPQGERGLDAKGPEPGNASFYYSAPRLRVGGLIHTRNASAIDVQGTAWMDREWSTSALSPDMAGWDWFALQLDDGRDVMFYRLRGTDGSTSPFSGGTIAGASGEVMRLDAEAVNLTVTRYWRSPVTDVRYPVAWRLDIPDAGLALAIEPRLDGQELDLSVRYWEGAVSIAGTASGMPIAGVGYLELAGY
jgi:predicted secreted hydrolase